MKLVGCDFPNIVGLVLALNSIELFGRSSVEIIEVADFMSCWSADGVELNFVLYNVVSQ